MIFHRDQTAKTIAPLCQRGEMEPEGSTTTTTTTTAIFPTTTTPALTTTTPDEVSECPEGWSRNQTSCYWVALLSYDYTSWVEANKRCPQFHPAAHLASSGSELENDFITKLHPGDPSHFWLGGEDFKEEGNWVWTDGTPFTFTNWLTDGHGTQGSGGPAQNCLAITTTTNDYYTGKWYDYECYATHAYMCEINIDNQ